MSIGKLLGAIVAAIALVVVVNFAGNFIYGAGAPQQTAMVGDEAQDAGQDASTAETSATADTATPAQADSTEPEATTQIAGLIGDPEAGKKVSRQCAACHTFDEGGPNRVGPNLWDVVGRKIASHQGFTYSDALKAVGGDWDLEKLHAWIHDPKSVAPGNKMTFAGVKNPDDLDNLIAYLQTLQPQDEIGKMGPQEEAAGQEAPATEEPAATEEPEPSGDASATEETPAEAPAATTEDAAPAEQQTAAAETPAAGGVSGDPAAGQKATRQCAACHTFDAGGPNRVGPNLHNVFESDIASHEGFNYSKALKGVEGTWTTDKLDAWIKSPRDFVKGNKMTFAGVKDDTERQNIIAYLASLKK